MALRFGKRASLGHAGTPGVPMSGRSSRRRPDGPEDANPLNRRLPAEVVSRRRRVALPTAVEAAEDAPVTLDRKAVFALKPPQREKWLKKALKQVADSQIRSSDLYDVIASTRFAEDIPYKLGQKMARAVQQQLSLFSGKQQRFLSAEATLVLKFGKAAQQGADASEAPGNGWAAPEAGVVAAPPQTSAEEMMARCRAFVRERMQERGEAGEPENGNGLDGPVAAPSATATLVAVPGPAATTAASAPAAAVAVAGAADGGAGTGAAARAGGSSSPSCSSDDRRRRKKPDSGEEAPGRGSPRSGRASSPQAGRSGSGARRRAASASSSSSSPAPAKKAGSSSPDTKRQGKRGAQRKRKPSPSSSSSSSPSRSLDREAKEKAKRKAEQRRKRQRSSSSSDASGKHKSKRSQR